MKATGIVRRIDDLGRIVVPKEIRRTLRIREGDIMDRDVFLRQLVERLFERQDFDFLRGTFRVRGEGVEVFPAYSEGEAIRVEFFGDEVERVSLIDSVSGRVRERLGSYTFFPAKQYVAAPEKRAAALKAIRQELADRVTWFEKEGRLLEAQRLKLASEIGRTQTDSVFVFDEPSIGLHPLDVQVLLGVFQALLDNGATVVVIEHDLDVIRNADYIIDMGPGGGDAGGRIVACGTPEQICNDPASITGRYLRR